MSLPTSDPSSAADARLARWLDAAGLVWLALLPALRPLVWSGDPASSGNLTYLSLLSAAIATALVRRGIGGPTVPWNWASRLGAIFLVVAAIGACRSDAPAAAWTLWLNWALHLGAAWALAPAIRAAPGVLLAGLLAGLVVQGAVLAGQVQWERPAVQAELASDPALIEHDRLRGQYEARASSWRLEGSFLLANTLAAYLIIVLPIAVGLAWSAWRTRHGSRWVLVGIALLCAMALIRTGSKMGMLAGLLACAGAANALLPRGRRWIPVAVTVLVCAVVLAHPGFRARLLDSAGVRIDYWRAGVAMVGEAPWLGHGLGGFETHYPRLKPLAAEETVIAHHEPLQAAVDLGIPAAVLLLAWWALGLRRLAAAGPIGSTELPMRTHWIIAAVTAGLMAYAIVIGGMVEERGLATWAVPIWIAALVLLTGAVIVGVRVPVLPRWCVPTGCAACLIHAWADFHLHSPQVVGILALVTQMGSPIRDDGNARPRRRWRYLAATAVLLPLSLVAILGLGIRHELGHRVDGAGYVLHRVQLERLHTTDGDDHGETQLRLGQILSEFGQPLALMSAHPEWELARLVVAEADPVVHGWPADPNLAMRVTTVMMRAQLLQPSAGVEFAPVIARYAERWPDHPGFADALADCTKALSAVPGQDRSRRLEEAQRWSETAIRLYPAHLPFRRRLVAIASARGDQATVEREQAELIRLGPLVHPLNR